MVNNTKKRFIFKIYGVSKKITENFKQHSFLCDYKVVDLAKIPIRKAPGKFTIIINLIPKRNYDVLAKQLRKFLKKNKIPKSRYGIHVSLVTSRDSDGIVVPMYVIKFMHTVNCICEFSFTCI